MLTRYVTVAYSSKQRFILEQRAVVVVIPSLAGRYMNIYIA
jgi:hypothetical protein